MPGRIRLASQVNFPGICNDKQQVGGSYNLNNVQGNPRIIPLGGSYKEMSINYYYIFIHSSDPFGGIFLQISLLPYRKIPHFISIFYIFLACFFKHQRSEYSGCNLQAPLPENILNLSDYRCFSDPWNTHNYCSYTIFVQEEPPIWAGFYQPVL